MEDRPLGAAAAAPPRPVAVDLFAGAGGFGLGFEQAGFDVAAAVEYDPIHAATHAFNFPLTEVVCADAADLTGTAVADAVSEGVELHGRADRPAIDVVFGGPPCQGFSVGGKRDKADPRNLLVFEFARLVAEIGPRYFVMENVPGIAGAPDPSQPGRSILDALQTHFDDLGYVLDQGSTAVLNSADYGVPQDRRRLFVVGRRPEANPVELSSALCAARPKRASAGHRADPPISGLPLGPSVSDALGDLPDIDGFDCLLSSDSVTLDSALHESLATSASTYARRLRGMDTDDDDYSYPRDWDRSCLTGSLRTTHSATSVARFASTQPGEFEPISRFYRLDPEGLSSTLRAGTGYDRGSFMAPRPIHPALSRVISVREAARLHSLPDWFRLHVTKWHGFRQVGNSLPPLLGRAVAASLRDAMGMPPPVRPTLGVQLVDPELLEMPMTAAAAYFDAAHPTLPGHAHRVRRRSDVDLGEALVPG